MYQDLIPLFFKCLEKPSADILLLDIFNHMSKDEVVEALLWIRQFIPKNSLVMPSLTVVRYLIQKNCLTEAKQQLSEVAKLDNCESWPAYKQLQDQLKDY